MSETRPQISVRPSSQEIYNLLTAEMGYSLRPQLQTLADFIEGSWGESKTFLQIAKKTSLAGDGLKKALSIMEEGGWLTYNSQTQSYQLGPTRQVSSGSQPQRHDAIIMRGSQVEAMRRRPERKARQQKPWVKKAWQKFLDIFSYIFQPPQARPQQAARRSHVEQKPLNSREIGCFSLQGGREYQQDVAFGPTRAESWFGDKENQSLQELFLEIENQTGLVVLGVADGVGSTKSGADAAYRGSEAVGKGLLEALTNNQGPQQALRTAMLEANGVVASFAQTTNEQQKGDSTLVAGVIQERRLYLTNSGDSRAYLLRGGRLTLLTKDQSLVQQLVDRGLISSGEVRNHPQRNVVTNTLGSSDFNPYYYKPYQLQAGDRLIFVSDGVSDPLTEQEITSIALSNKSSQVAARALAQRSVSLAGARADNATAVVYDVS